MYVPPGKNSDTTKKNSDITIHFLPEKFNKFNYILDIYDKFKDKTNFQIP